MQEVCTAQTGRIKILNDYLIDLFIRTRRSQLVETILDVDASDDPVHGHQRLSGYHGYYCQHQYLPLLGYDGNTVFPLAAWLRPGVVHASLGAVAILDVLVRRRPIGEEKLIDCQLSFSGSGFGKGFLSNRGERT